MPSVFEVTKNVRFDCASSSISTGAKARVVIYDDSRRFKNPATPDQSPGLPRCWLQCGCRELLSPFSNHWTEKRDETKVRGFHGAGCRLERHASSSALESFKTAQRAGQRATLMDRDQNSENVERAGERYAYQRAPKPVQLRKQQVRDEEGDPESD